MTLHLFTGKEKLCEIERIIVALKRDGSRPIELSILQAIAVDMRADLPGTSDLSIERFEELLRKVERSRTTLGYSKESMTELALNFITLWPTLRAALVERAKAEKESVLRRQP